MRALLLAFLLPSAAIAGLGPVDYTPPLSLSGQAVTPATVAASTVTLSLSGASVPAGTFPYSPLMIFGNANTYLQAVIQNLSNGNNASGDVVITNDLGNDSSFFLDLGINSSKFSQAGQSVEASSSTFLASSDSDLVLWAGTNGGLNSAASEKIILGSSNPVTANGSVVISSVGMVVGGSASTLAQIGAPLDVISTTQGLGVPVLTTAQVQASTPKKAGQIIYNSTLNLPCISTGTTIQGYSRFTGSTTCQ